METNNQRPVTGKTNEDTAEGERGKIEQAIRHDEQDAKDTSESNVVSINAEDAGEMSPYFDSHPEGDEDQAA